MSNARKQIIKAIQKTVGEVDVHLETPEIESHGDYSTNIAMRLFSKSLIPEYTSDKTVYSPRELAEQIVQKLKKDINLRKSVSKIEAVGGGFINFWLAKTVLEDELKKVLKEKDKHGQSDLLKGKKYLLEHTSPNPNKAMHLGHLRNNVTGMAIANIFEFVGAEVIRDAIDNNRGIAIARLMWGYLRFARKDGVENTDVSYWYKHQGEWQTPGDVGTRPDRFVDELYVKASKDFKENEKVETKVKQLVVDWEDEDIETRALWKKVLSYSYEGQKQTLERLGNKWDKVWHEHEHYKMGKDMVQGGVEKGIFKRLEDGAVVSNLSKYNLTDTILIKSDGTALYITQDIALTKLKMETFKPDKAFWVIGPEQSLALKQLFAICEQLGIGRVEDYIHIAYGWMSLKGKGKMSSRTGDVIFVDDLLDLARDAIIKKMDKSSFSKKQINEISEVVGVGAVKYSILKAGRLRDSAFDIKQSVSLEGNSGPYLQYTYARTQSVLNKVKGERFKVKGIKYDNINKEELSLLRSFIHFQEVVESAAKNYSPNLLCNYLYDLAQKFNGFYNSCRILEPKVKGKGQEVKEFRVALTAATGQILKNGLGLLGIQAPERM